MIGTDETVDWGLQRLKEGGHFHQRRVFFFFSHYCFSPKLFLLKKNSNGFDMWGDSLFIHGTWARAPFNSLTISFFDDLGRVGRLP